MDINLIGVGLMYDKNLMLNAEQTNLNTKHHFSDSIYAKEMTLPAGHVALSHKHSYSHLSVLAMGECIVETDGDKNRYSAPAVIEIKAGVEHQITAIKDVTWLCIHATEEKDPKKIDEVAIASV